MSEGTRSHRERPRRLLLAAAAGGKAFFEVLSALTLLALIAQYGSEPLLMLSVAALILWCLGTMVAYYLGLADRRLTPLLKADLRLLAGSQQPESVATTGKWIGLVLDLIVIGIVMIFFVSLGGPLFDWVWSALL